jgi:hypothetical protein
MIDQHRIYNGGWMGEKNEQDTLSSDPGLPLSNNQTMSCDMWQMPFAVAMGSGYIFIVLRASEN